MRYVSNNQYGLARDDVELAMNKINEIDQTDVYTPLYYSIKRTKDFDRNSCYIIQENAKGKSCIELESIGEIIEIPKNIIINLLQI